MRPLLSSVGVFALCFSIVACSGRTYYTPDVVAIVSAAEPLPDGASRLSLMDGRSLIVDPHVQKVVVGGDIADAGELFLAGSAPSPWVARLAGTDPCFWIGGSGTEDGDFIATAGGLRLPKAVDFDRRHYHETEHEFNSGGFCVNAAGEITGIR